ncbi:ATP-binding protein [Gordonia rubripertincta]|uniref:histidine kinase n=1 Tax=Gordonia rubripertincta TaxID=36822 RepID=A0AAW4G780_GORRU|nr:ATP-binding protein [Gordonia rubripertincta]MBM7279094.1 ATP-binding protein [Gordonia rubripertincta]
MDAERPLELAPDDVADLVTTAVGAARATAPHRTVRLSIRAVPAVDADQGRLHQVVSNLLANALRHTPDEAQVRVAVGQEGTDAVITVSDDGPGMTRQDADRAFERFHRADTSRTRAEGGGSGLGLSIVDELVRAHGGTVSLTTAPGQGATFTVRLPTG